jgi:hypothetical protein
VKPLQAPRRSTIRAMTARSDGRLGLLWMDYGNDQKGECYEAYFRASLDAGRTWLAPLRLSAKPSCAKLPGNVVRRADGTTRNVSDRWTEGGDYHGLVAGEGGQFYAAWSDSSSGVFQIHFAAVEADDATSAPLR